MMGLSGRFFGHMGASLIDRNICGPTVGAGHADDERQRPRHGRARARTLPAHPAVGHQHQAHQPPSVADHRDGPLQRRPHRGDRPDPHRDGRGHRCRPRRPVHPALPRHRHRDDAGDDARHHPRRADERRMDRRAHARLRRVARGGRRLDPRAGGRGQRRRGRHDHLARRRLRDDPTGRDPHDHRRRAPRERRDVLPHARLPARAHRCLGRTRRRHRQERRVVQRRAHRRRQRSSAPTSGAIDGRPRTADVEHEPARRHPHRPARRLRHAARGSTRWSCGTRIRSSSCPTPN